MPRSASHAHQPVSFRLLAATLALLVLALGLLAVAPAAHQHLHDDADHPEHTCAVVLFAQGLTAAAAFWLLVTPLRRVGEMLLPARTEPVASPKRLLPPACGPPAA